MGAQAMIGPGEMGPGNMGPGDPEDEKPEPDETPQAAMEGEGPPELEDPVRDLPSVETITEATDLAPWLKPGIPAALRNAALRRKWLLNPAIRDHVDPAVDYHWDWNAATPVPGSGGRVLDETARRMLDGLRGKPAVVPADKADPGGAAAQADAERPGAAPSTETKAAAAQPEPGSGAAPAGVPCPAENAKTDPVPLRPETPRRVRRHGGAVPLTPNADGEKS